MANILIRGARKFRNLMQPAISPFQSKVIILLYHRVFKPNLDPQLLCVTEKNFTEHLEYLSHNYDIMSLSGLIISLKEGKLPKRGVVITFDDGYADNFLNAKPILDRYSAPATVFVSTGNVDSAREFWWDDLERLILNSGTLPEKIQLKVDEADYEWELGDTAYYDEAESSIYADWNVLDKQDPTPRHQFYRSLCKILLPLPSSEQSSVLNQLYSLSKKTSEGRLSFRALSSDQVYSLSESGLVEIGAHTVTHPQLSKLSEAEQGKEIMKSKNKLSELLDRSVVSFAYPYGTRTDYTSDTVSIVHQAGFDCACSNFPGVVKSSTDKFQLPRMLVRDWSKDEFASRLRYLFGRG